ncbi:hypothetical protein PPBDW_II0906 [Photobacterium kishitanii]|nr:hypothetical protein PPBDW_II0906 [Photobacterium kishitanii]
MVILCDGCEIKFCHDMILNTVSLLKERDKSVGYGKVGKRVK